MVTVFGFDRNGNFDSDFAGDGGFVYLDDYNELKCYIDHLESRIAELEKACRRVTAAFRALGEATAWTREAERARHECESAMLELDAAVDESMIREA